MWGRPFHAASVRYPFSVVGREISYAVCRVKSGGFRDVRFFIRAPRSRTVPRPRLIVFRFNGGVSAFRFLVKANCQVIFSVTSIGALREVAHACPRGSREIFVGNVSRRVERSIKCQRTARNVYA